MPPLRFRSVPTRSESTPATSSRTTRQAWRRAQPARSAAGGPNQRRNALCRSRSLCAVLFEERAIGEAALEQMSMDGECDREIRAGRSARCRSACLASGVVRGSMTISFAPRRCASRRYGTMWMPDADGFTPHTMMSVFANGIVLVGHRRILPPRRRWLRGAHTVPRGGAPPR